jgi:SAM-dependent methyltransferase
MPKPKKPSQKAGGRGQEPTSLGSEVEAGSGVVAGSGVGSTLARYYDLDLAEEQPDLDMYLALAATTDGPILELASGSGRIAVPLAAAGHDVTGVDRDPHMLDRARAAWAARTTATPGRRKKGSANLELIERDITDLRLGRRFGLVILALNSLLLFPDRAAQLAVLKTMNRHLSRGGRAVLDVWLPAPEDLVLYDGRVVLDWVRRDDETDEHVSKSSSAHYFPATATATIHAIFDAWSQGGPARRISRRDDVCFIGATELVALVERAGLSVEIAAGDYTMGERVPDTDRIVLVGRSDSD